MILLLKLLGFASVVTVTNSISVDTDCIASNRHEAQLHGTQTHITAWIRDSADTLILTLGYDTGHPSYYDSIEVKLDAIIMTRTRRDEKTRRTQLNFIQSLENGWQTLDFVAEDKYRFNFTSQNVFHEFDGETKRKLTQFTVEGSNITVNCKFDTIYWKISNDITVIPLLRNSTNTFSLFSRTTFQPTLVVGNFQPTLAVDNASIELGFKDNAINDIRPYKAEHQIPLPRYEEHMVEVKCIPHHNCIYTLGIDGDTRTIKKHFIRNNTNLIIQGKGNEFFIKLIREKPKIYIISTTKPSTNPPTITTSTDWNSWVSTIVLSVILMLVIPITASLILYMHRKEHKEEREMVEETNRLLTSNEETQARLWDAVAHNDQVLVKLLLESGEIPTKRTIGKNTSALQEAHILGYKEIVKMFADNLNVKQSVPTQEQIEFTLRELEKRMDKVFKAAKDGKYERGNGVNVLLKTHSLPGTIRDYNGFSLIHYMANSKLSNETPTWIPMDIKSFFKEHEFYINAIDHWGNTPLHILAKQKGNKDIIWDGQTMPVEKAWIEMARIFIRKGCDPRIPNHQNILPHDLAKSAACNKMATYLEEKCDELGEIDHASLANDFEDLVKASKNNELEQMKKLLKLHVPMLPIFAQRDPLVEAIRNGNRDVFFLLVSAGTPICNCSIDDLTPLETAHNTLGLPALFPALMRKIYSDRLKAERSQITQKDEGHLLLATGLEDIQKAVRKKGDKIKWQFKTEKPFDDRSNEARKLLVAASGLGLSLTVQLLGLEDVDLRPLPSEDSPVEKAQYEYIDTLYALYRDLRLTPYATPEESSKVLKRLGGDLLIAECIILKKCALDNRQQPLIGLDEHKVQAFLDQFSKPIGIDHDWSLYDSNILYILARYGLIYLLDTYRKGNKDKANLDEVVQEFSRSTMLHISVLYGQPHITEYLIYHDASLELETVGGYTAAHIAAIVGHEDSMNYIISKMKIQDISIEKKCELEMTPKELMDQYLKMREGSNYPFVEPDDALNVKNEIGESDIALEILRSKAKVMGIEYEVELISKVKEIQQKYKGKNVAQAKGIIQETECLFKGIKNPFQGDLKECGQHGEDNIIFRDDIIRFTLELKDYSAHGNSKNIIIEKQPRDDFMALILKKDSNSENYIFQNNNFMTKFIEAVKELIKDYEPSNSNYNLVPPFLTPHTCGVELSWACNLDGSFYKVKSYIDPVIKADLPEDNGIKGFPEHIRKLCEDAYVEIHLTNLKGEWTYRGYSLETKIFGSLNENEKMVWTICRFIKLISKKYWWTPTSNIHKPVHRLNVDYVGIKFPQERALKALFLHELAENHKNWEEKDIFDRVVSIYKRCVPNESNEELSPVTSVKSFLIPTSYSIIMPESVIGVVHYLENIKRGARPKGLKHPVAALCCGLNHTDSSPCLVTQTSNDNSENIALV